MHAPEDSFTPSRRIPRPVVVGFAILMIALLLSPVLNLFTSWNVGGGPGPQRARTPVGDLLERRAAMAEVQAWIDANPRRLEEISWLGRTPLLEAIEAQRHDVIAALLAAGADPDHAAVWTYAIIESGEMREEGKKDPTMIFEKGTPLQTTIVPLKTALDLKDGRAVVLLLEAGADPAPLREAAGGDLEGLGATIGVPDLAARLDEAK